MSLTNQTTKTELMLPSDTQSVEMQVQTKQSYMEILEKLLNALVNAQTEISQNTQVVFKFDSNMLKNLSTMTDIMCQQMQKNIEENKEKQKQAEDSKKVTLAFSIIGAVIACVLGYIFGGVGGVLMSAVLAALTLTGALDKAVEWVAQKISGEEHPPEWLKAVIAIVITIVIAVAGGCIAGATNFILAQTMPRVFGQVAEQVATTVAKQVTEEEVKDAAVTIAKQTAMTVVKTTLVQTLAATGALQDLDTAVLEACKVDEKTAKLVGSIVAAITILLLSVASLSTDTGMIEVFQQTANMGLLSRIATTSQSLSQLAQDGAEIATGAYNLQLANFQSEYAQIEGTMNTLTNASSNMNLFHTVEFLKGVLESYTKIFSTMKLNISSEEAARLLAGA